jgi:hypothetical protein
MLGTKEKKPIIDFSIRISINSGAALFIYLLSLFILYFGSKGSQILAQLFPSATWALTFGFGGFLAKRGYNNKISVEGNNAISERACAPIAGPK